MPSSQAFVNKHYQQRNAQHFAPQHLRSAMPNEKSGQAGTSFVQLQGLGKIPFSNVRRPKPLMEFTPGGENPEVTPHTPGLCPPFLRYAIVPQASQGGYGGTPGWAEYSSLYKPHFHIEMLAPLPLCHIHNTDPPLHGSLPRRLCVSVVALEGKFSVKLFRSRSASPDFWRCGAQHNGMAEAGGRGGAAARPLEQEPALAARIMIEDCMNLLLDVQDIDRLFSAHPTGKTPTLNLKP